MDILSLYNVNSGAIRNTEKTSSIGVKAAAAAGNDDMFGSLLNSAINNLNTTNGYLSDAENEEIKLALGETDNAHDLTIALNKASTALQYTVAIRDKFLEAYKEIMQIQI